MFHPSIVLLLWSLVVTLSQLADGAPLFAGVGVLLLMGFGLARDRLFTLIRRVRYLLAAIVLVFAWATPGYLIAPGLGPASPTAEGLWQALTHAARLLCVLALVALLLERMPLPRLVCALHGVTWPLGLLGLDRPRAALRLMLVLRYTSRPRELPDWRHWLDDAAAPEPAEEVEIQHHRLSPFDWAMLALIASFIIWFWQ